MDELRVRGKNGKQCYPVSYRTNKKQREREKISANRLYLLIWTKYVVHQNDENRVFIIRLSSLVQVTVNMKQLLTFWVPCNIHIQLCDIELDSLPL